MPKVTEEMLQQPLDLDPETGEVVTVEAKPVEKKLSDIKETSQIGALQTVNHSAGYTDLQSFELAQRAGKLLAASKLVPNTYQNNLPDCVIALEMANRMGASPLLVMQNLYIVYGRPAWSAKFLIACFNQLPGYSSIEYEWIGKEGTDGWGCKAHATNLRTGQKLTGPTITIDLAKKEKWYDKTGSKWQTMPQKMLMYRAAAWFIDVTAPEISMGFQTREEGEDVGYIDAVVEPVNDKTLAEIGA